MKISIQQLLNGVKIYALILMFGIVTGVSAGVYYVRPAGDTSSWGSLTGINANQIITSNAPVIDTISTYYFAKGTYVLTATAIDPETTLPVQITPKLTTGKILEVLVVPKLQLICRLAFWKTKMQMVSLNLGNLPTRLCLEVLCLPVILVALLAVCLPLPVVK
jgi:hypothetical protein